jgi:protein tyrosine/serine phosphatase
MKEKAWAQSAGLKYFNIPLSTSRPATAQQTEYFLKLVNNPANWPVYVHCAAGRHRTGAMTAIYRITQDSWTADLAYKEMKKYGYYSFPNHGSLKKFVYKYFESFLGSRIGTHSTSHPSPGWTPAMALEAD